jgi:hypothetical protein
MTRVQRADRFDKCKLARKDNCVAQRVQLVERLAQMLGSRSINN